MATAETNISIKPGSITVTSIDSDGLKSSKDVSMHSLKEIFSRTTGIETPFLPSQWGVVKYYSNESFDGYVITTPPTERKVTVDQYDEDLHLTIPVPPLLWIFEVSKRSNKVRHSMVYALKHELLSMSDNIFKAPFPNIGISEGICWGQTIDVPSPKSIQSLPARFFSAPFNTDLSSEVVRRFEYKGDINIGDRTHTENALYHMYHLDKQLKIAKENGEEYFYPFDDLRRPNESTIDHALRRYLPGIFDN